MGEVITDQTKMNRGETFKTVR